MGHKSLRHGDSGAEAGLHGAEAPISSHTGPKSGQPPLPHGGNSSHRGLLGRAPDSGWRGTEDPGSGSRTGQLSVLVPAPEGLRPGQGHQVVLRAAGKEQMRPLEEPNF